MFDKYPLLFLHGLNCDANLWTSASENNVLPFIFANQNYDIWVIN